MADATKQPELSKQNYSAGVSDWLKASSQSVFITSVGQLQPNQGGCNYHGVLYPSEQSAWSDKSRIKEGLFTESAAVEPTEHDLELAEASWDARIARDERSGKLDKVKQRAREMLAKGQYTDL